VPLVAARWDTRARMRARGLSGQDGLRVLRREFLRRAARRVGARAIATAHNADDQLETMLMRLARGAGLAGLGGMRERRGGWLKPLLEVPRADIEADLARAGIGWREDGSNLDRRYLRNRIRHDALPVLIAALAPGQPAGRVRAGLARRAAATAREAREALRALRRWTSPALPPERSAPSAEFALDSRVVASYPSAARRAALTGLWRRLPRPLPGLTRRHLEALERLTVRGASSARVALPGGWVARRERGQVRFWRPSSHRSTETP